jgi:hypothetical protein
MLDRDASGKRRYVSWAGLAIVVLVAGGLVLLIVQPFGGDSGSDAAVDPGSEHAPLTPGERKAEAVERRLAESPNNAKLLRTAMFSWIEAGGEQISKAGHIGRPFPSAAVQRDFKAGLRAWNGYLRQTGGEADVNTAEAAGVTFFRLMELGSRNLAEIETNAADAARALRIAGRHRQSLFTLSNVAVYEYYNGEFAAGDRAGAGAAADVPKGDRPGVFENLHEYRENAEYFRGQLRRAAQELRETGAEELKEPLKAFASTADLNQEEPASLARGR